MAKKEQEVVRSKQVERMTPVKLDARQIQDMALRGMTLQPEPEYREVAQGLMEKMQQMWAEPEELGLSCCVQFCCVSWCCIQIS